MRAIHTSEAFGLRWLSDVDLPGFEPDSSDAGRHRDVVVVRCVSGLPQRAGGRVINRGLAYADGIRVAWGREVAFDMVGGDRIDYCPGEDWTGAMPAFFYSTVAALTLAWRGMVPLHACAVEIDGTAILIAGASGAGKSTLTAGLLVRGALLVADDLTVVDVNGSGSFRVLRGRPTIRLHRDTAEMVPSVASRPVEGDPRGKWIVQPKRRSTADVLPLGAVLLLESSAGEGCGGGPDRLLTHMFRRRWMGELPRRDHVVATTLAISRSGLVLPFPAQGDFEPAKQRDRVEAALRLIRRSRGHHRADLKASAADGIDR